MNQEGESASVAKNPPILEWGEVKTELNLHLIMPYHSPYFLAIFL